MLGGRTRDGACGHRAHRRGSVKVAPIDAEIISGFGENRLRLRSHAQHIEIADLFARPFHRLVLRIHHELRGVGVVNGNRVRAAVHRADFPNEIGDRAGIDVQVAGQERGEERQRDVNSRSFELINRAGGENGQPHLW